MSGKKANTVCFRHLSTMARTRAGKALQKDENKKKVRNTLKKANGKKGKGPLKAKVNRAPSVASAFGADGSGNMSASGSWRLDITREPRICSEMRVIAKDHVCYMRIVSLFSEVTGARFDARQFCIEKSYFNRNTGAKDKFIFTIKADALPALTMACNEFNRVSQAEWLSGLKR